MAAKKAIFVKFDGTVPEGGGKLSQKALAIPSFADGEYEGVQAAVKCAPAELPDALEKGGAFFHVVAQSEAELDSIAGAADRRTTIAVAAQNGLFFYGYGILKGALVKRSARAKDIIPTLAYIAGLPVWPEATGAVLYQVLKDPDMHVTEVGKLKTALERMERALARESREPWDKHDCA